MNWKNIEVKGSNPDGTFMLDIVDVYECQKENKPANCTGCPYIRTCNKYETKHNKFVSEILHNVIPEFNPNRN